MPHRRLAHVDTTLSERIASIEIARARLFDVDIDRKKRIDDAIDYFGARRARVGRDPCGESWLDQARSR
jgi:hypothetical protein